jgi:hypothetical protein
VVPWRWVVERTFGWFNRYRRLSKDYECNPKSSETRIDIALIGRMSRSAYRRQTATTTCSECARSELGSGRSPFGFRRVEVRNLRARVWALAHASAVPAANSATVEKVKGVLRAVRRWHALRRRQSEPGARFVAGMVKALGKP